MTLDDRDKKLLILLQNDAKLTTKQLANELQLSPTAVFERIKKIERQGIIEKYVALVDRSKIQKDFLVLCHIKLSQHKKEYIVDFENQIKNLKEILECFHVSGDYDYILKICVKDMREYREFMVTKLTNLQHIASTHSSFIINEVKGTTEVYLD